MYNLDDIITKYPKMTRKEEKDLLARYNDNPNEVKDKLFLHNVALVPYVVKKMYWVRDENQWDEYISHGIAGLRNAAEKFDPKTNFRFSTYAVTTIRHHIFRMTKISKIDMACYHIDTPLHSDDDPNGDGERTVEQLIYKDINPDFIVLKETTHYVENDSKRILARKILTKLLATCSSKSEIKRFNCVIDYYCKSKPDGSRFTLKDLGEKYGVSRERIRQMINMEMKIIRTRLFNRMLISSRFGVDGWLINRKQGMIDYREIVEEFRD